MDVASGHNRRVAPEKRKRTEKSCDKCKTRKQKCDRVSSHTHCRYCELHGLACSFTQPSKKRLYGSAESVTGRLVLLETLVKGLVPEADLSSNDEMIRLGESLGIPLPTVESACEDSPRTEVKDEDHSLSLLPDQQGQVQYIGPASSFSFHHHLRRLIGNSPACEFAMFGRNAADQVHHIPTSKQFHPEHSQYSPGSVVGNIISSLSNSHSDIMLHIDASAQNTLFDSYFDKVNSDFPVLHEASFRETYETWANSLSNPGASWLCCVLCVLILSRRVAHIDLPEEAERKWWRHVQMVLPTVFFTSNVSSVQALMLAALHLHNTSHRDACWNLTGTAVRVAFAIGLHRDDIQHEQSPLCRELRKQLWWTLYSFEHMQVSSYDRPSSIANTVSSVSCPNERIVGISGHCPPEIMRWSMQLALILSSTYKALHHTGAGKGTVTDAYSAPLSPAANVLRDLDRWKNGLPRHLRWEVASSHAISSQRSIILLHVQYYYIVILMSRSALLRQAMYLSNRSLAPLPESQFIISETCVQAGRRLAQLLRKLDDIGRFNAITWWDIFYTVAASLILALDVICAVKQQKARPMIEKSLTLLVELSTTVVKHLKNPHVPESMRTWGGIIIDVHFTVKRYVASQSEAFRHPDILPTTMLPQQRSANRRYSDIISLNENKDNSTGDCPNVGKDNSSQFCVSHALPDQLNNSLYEWIWDDIGGMSYTE
ncbi:fungal specific transcription factor domain-containing protein [Phlyctema vagabunda]|uniref:Fungal specific transcription factor domain-containing protein n=1 Tax=Phlyctema vagabunda TaxID=108571 RepID=A0ABR4PHM5_9HELO